MGIQIATSSNVLCKRAGDWHSSEVWCSARLTHKGCSGFASGDLPEYVRHTHAHSPGLAEAGGGSWQRMRLGFCHALSLSLSLADSWKTYINTNVKIYWVKDSELSLEKPQKKLKIEFFALRQLKVYLEKHNTHLGKHEGNWTVCWPCLLGNSKLGWEREGHTLQKTLISEGGRGGRTLLSFSLFGSIITCTFSSVFMQETKFSNWSRDESF